MGGSWSETVHHLPESNARLVPHSRSHEQAIKSDSPTLNRKRSCPESSDEDVEELSPSRKRIKNTSKYIYETLFLNGTNHDVTITALGMLYVMHCDMPFTSHLNLQARNGNYIKCTSVR